VICALYNFPGHLADPEEGRKQYMELDEEIEEDPEVREMVVQMEAAYDARAKALFENAPQPPLSPQVDQFLRDLDRRFDDR
jgi:nucleoid-associated protein YejK